MFYRDTSFFREILAFPTPPSILNQQRSALRSTSRLGFSGVPNALNLELNLLRFFKVALVVASWRVVLHCSRIYAPSPLRLACCARGRVVLYRSGGDPTPPFSAALGLTAALGFHVRVNALCVS
jgi:hypothetical protein